MHHKRPRARWLNPPVVAHCFTPAEQHYKVLGVRGMGKLGATARLRHSEMYRKRTRQSMNQQT